MLRQAAGSMEPTINVGETVLAVPGEPVRGDVVVFTGGDLDPSMQLKRVIGLPGDVVEIRVDGRVYVNEVALDEPYLFKDAHGTAEPTLAAGEARWVIAAGQLFVLGDRRQRSMDSRMFGPIMTTDVVGIVTWRCRPEAAPLARP
jgi:signal peptidase I